MNFYYDLVLNFLEDNYYFYDWDEQDPMEYIKKIPLFQVNSKTFRDFFGNVVKVNKEFLKEIENKTIKKKQKLKYACLIADKNNVWAYEFNDDGTVISRSSLMLKDELGILEYLYTIPMKEIKYEIIKKMASFKNIRLCEKIKKFIKLEINKLAEKNDVDKLKYLYLEWFNQKEDNVNLIVEKMYKRLDKDISVDELNIYNIIKLSYNNV